METGKKERILYLDALRVLASVFVVMLHLSAQKFDGLAIGSADWTVLNCYNSLTRWAVPVFVMISGALFLDPARQIRPRALFGKNLLRIVSAFVFWSGLYALVDYWQGKRLRDVAFGFVTGHIHLWFLYMIAGLYLVVPLLRQLTESEKMTRYFLLLWGLFAVAYPTCRSLLAVFDGYADWMTAVSDKMDLGFVCGFTGYFVLGRLLCQADLSRRLRTAVYLLGLGGYAATVLLTFLCSRRTGIRCDDFYGPFSGNVLCMAVAVFVFGKYHLAHWKEGIARHALLRCSACSFGVYLVHFMIVQQLDLRWQIHVLLFPPLLAVPVLTVFVFLLSLAVSFLLRQIPLVKTYLV